MTRYYVLMYILSTQTLQKDENNKTLQKIKKNEKKDSSEAKDKDFHVQLFNSPKQFYYIVLFSLKNYFPLNRTTILYERCLLVAVCSILTQ